jgi:beta-glucosidase
VGAILVAWFPGQEFGGALADVMLGVVEPGGRLPTTWPSSEDGLPSTQPAGGVLSYDEGLFIGYRAYDRDGRTPHYPFGHGLGYTTWSYDAIEAPAEAAPGDDLSVTVHVTNAGARRGREVVQLYASRSDGRIERPLRWLAGFAPVEAEAGATVTATVTVPARAFEHWDAVAGGWTVEPGTFGLTAGPSSADLARSTRVTIAPAA